MQPTLHPHPDPVAGAGGRIGTGCLKKCPPDFLLQERDRIQSEYESRYGPEPACDSGTYAGPPDAQLVASAGQPVTGSNVAQENLKRYLARIAAGESSGGRNIGPNYLGARGWYQFKPGTRQLLMRRRQYRHLDPWSSNKQIQDQAALAWIDLYGREKRVNILGAIQQGNFQLADRVLGRNQFTSLPGGAEQHAIWRNPTNSIRYGPVGKSGGPLFSLCTAKLCPST